MDNGACSYRRFLDGDTQAIAELVSEYKDGLLLFLNGYVNNIYVAEELTEDTFFRLMTKKPRFDRKSTFKSWLYAIGRNVAIDAIRHNKKSVSVPIEDMANYLQDTYDLERAYIKEEDKIAVHKALSQLNTDYQTVLWLMFFEGFTGEETAKILKKSNRQVQNLLYRAKQNLKIRLEKEGFEYEGL